MKPLERERPVAAARQAVDCGCRRAGRGDPARVPHFNGHHPDNAAALKYYNEMRTAFDKAAAEYEDAFGPLTAREVDTCSGHWTWIDDPWPWEGAED